MKSRRKENLRGYDAPVHLFELGISAKWLRRIHGKNKSSRLFKYISDKLSLHFRERRKKTSKGI